MPWTEQARALLNKARQDAVIVEMAVQYPEVSDEVLGFHLQQAGEKCMKGVLAVHSTPYRRTHDLQELHDLLDEAGITMPTEVIEMVGWSPYAVTFRYEDVPGVAPADRGRAVVLARAALSWCEDEIEQAVANLPPSASSP